MICFVQSLHNLSLRGILDHLSVSIRRWWFVVRNFKQKEKEIFPNSLLFVSVVSDWSSVIWQCWGIEHFLSAHLIITCWSSAGFTIHVPGTCPPAIIKTPWLGRQDQLLGCWWWSSTGTSVEKITCATWVWRRSI